MKYLIKLKNHHNLRIGTQIIFYEWAMSQKLPLNSFNWVKNNLNLIKVSKKL